MCAVPDAKSYLLFEYNSIATSNISKWNAKLYVIRLCNLPIYIEIPLHVPHYKIVYYLTKH